MQKSKTEMVWPCEKERGELHREEVKYGSTWKERKGSPEAMLDGHHQGRYAVYWYVEGRHTRRKDLEDIYICHSDLILNGRRLKKKYYHD